MDVWIRKERECVSEWERKRGRKRERERESLDWVTTCSNPEKQSQKRDDFCGQTRKAKTKTFSPSLSLSRSFSLTHTHTHKHTHTYTHVRARRRSHSHTHNLSFFHSLMLHCLKAFLYERRGGLISCSSQRQQQLLCCRHLVMNLHWGKSNSVAERSRDWINFPRLEETEGGKW